MKSKDYNASLWDTAEELNRNDCFNDLAYRNMTFDRDDRPEHLLSKAARAYAENFQPALEQHGIMFTGNVGTGKTFYAFVTGNVTALSHCDAGVTPVSSLFLERSRRIRSALVDSDPISFIISVR